MAWISKRFGAYLAFGLGPVPAFLFENNEALPANKNSENANNAIIVTPAPVLNVKSFEIPAKYIPLTTQTSNCLKERASVLVAPDECVAALTRWYTDGCKFGVVDIRDKNTFVDAHIVQSTSLPWGDNGQEFWSLLHELPPRGKTPNTVRICSLSL